MPRLPWNHELEERQANLKRDLATAGVGLGGVAGAAALRESGISGAHRAQRRTKRMLIPGRSLLATGAGGGNRAKYLAGSTIGLASAVPLGVGAYNAAHPKRRVAVGDVGKRGFIGEGVIGSKEALSDKVDAWHERGVSPQARVLAAGAATGTGMLGSLGAHKVLDAVARRRGVGGKTRAAITATTGVLTGVSSLPVSQRVVSRGTGRNYVVTPTGVRRPKTPPRRPSRHADVSTRPQHREFGKNVRGAKAGTYQFALFPKPPKVKAVRPPAALPSAGAREPGKQLQLWRNPRSEAQRAADDARSTAADERRRVQRARDKMTMSPREFRRKYPPGMGGAIGSGYGARPWSRPGGHIGKADEYLGSDMSRKQKRLAVYAAGSAGPLIGDAAAIGTAARLAPPHQRKRAALSQGLGANGGQLVGATTGALALRGAARINPKVEARAKTATHYMHPKSWYLAASGRRAEIGKPKPPGRVARAAPKTAARLGRAATKLGPAGVAGGVLGGVVGGHVGGYAGYGHALNREDRWRHSQGMAPLAKAEFVLTAVNKAVPATGLTQREHHELVARKKRNAGVAMLSATLGAAGFGAGVATLTPLRHRVPKHLIPRIERAGLGTALTSGGVGSVQTMSNARIARKETKAELAVAKAWLPRRNPTLRAISRRRAETGPGARNPRRLEDTRQPRGTLIARRDDGRTQLAKAAPVLRPVGLARKQAYRASSFRQPRRLGAAPVRVRASLG